jgi:diguanylate cyclase (GGDEF)-like protein
VRGFQGNNRFSGLPVICRSLRGSYLFLALGLLLLILLPLCSLDNSHILPNFSLLVASPLLLLNILLAFLFSVHVRQKNFREQRRLYDIFCRISEKGSEAFFPALVTQLSDFLGADYVHVGRFAETSGDMLKVLAVCRDGQLEDIAQVELAGAPCVKVFEGDVGFAGRDLRRRFPDSALVADLQAVSYLGHPLRDATGEVVGVISAFGRKRLKHGQRAMMLLAFLAQHASAELERSRVQLAMERMAYHDPLTEMSNWRFFRERLVTTLGRAQQSGQPFGLVFLDVDRFKNVNQSLGHEAGDHLLRLFAERMAGTLDDQAIISRKGGDRFFILLPHLLAVADVHRMAEGLLTMLRDPFEVQGREVYLSISIGIVTCPADGDTIATLLAHADAAMHRAKEMGGGRIERYAPAMEAASRVRLGLEGALRKALKNGEFLLHYQPQYQLRAERIVGDEGLLHDRVSSRLVGAESLIRWRHPGRGLVSPMEFIPLAEETGLIEEIGTWVLESACCQLRRWRQWFGADFKMSVNLSARQLYDPTLVDKIASTLAFNGLRPEVLCLELTESCLMGSVQESQEQLQRLRRLGVGISIDDFGTGYSSLSYLRRFPVTALKIDSSFVQDIGEHADHQAIVKSIIAMAQVLKLEVVAEGVETEQQLSCLYAAGCRTVQGYLLGRPMAAEDFATLANAGGDEQFDGFSQVG